MIQLNLLITTDLTEFSLDTRSDQMFSNQIYETIKIQKNNKALVSTSISANLD